MSEISSRLSTALGHRYTIERQLGEGGMATVYLAHDVKHDRKVAIKVLRPELAAVLGAERFVQEIKTTANLQHPHILPLFDSGEADGFLYYVMPYVEGETLRDKLNREKQLGIDEAVKITSEVADALDYAHRHNVIHRDIKPENILLHDGRPMVADFGIALAVSAAAGGRMTETGLSLGTPHYMSPEQATAEKDLGSRSDIYSLGAVLYEMLTGNPPHVGSTAQQIIMKIVTEDPAPVTRARRSVPSNVEAAVSKALEKLPADRFGTARELAGALGDPTFSAGISRPTHRGASDRAPWLRAGAIGVGAGVVLTTAAFLIAMRRAPEPVEYWTLATPAELDTVPIARLVDFSPDDGQMVFVSVNSNGQWMLQLRALDQPVGGWLLGTEGAEYPRFSPEGDRVAFLAPPGVLKWVDLEGGTPQRLAEVALVSRGLCWGADRYIYFPRPSTDVLPGGISRVPDRGGAIEHITTVDTSRAEFLHGCTEVLPGGRGLLYQNDRAGGYESQELATYSFDTRQSKVLLPGLSSGLTPRGDIIYLTSEGILEAAPFDLKTLEIAGPAVSLASGVFRNVDYGSFVLSKRGTLLYADMSPRLSRLAWISRAGNPTGIDAPNLQDIVASALSPTGDRITAVIIRDGQRELWVYALPGGPWTRVVGPGTNPDRPAWHPDGTRITYIATGSNDLTTVFVVAADGGSPPEELRRPTAIPVQDGKFSPDGRWLVFRQGPVGPMQRDILYSYPHPDSAAHELVVTTDDELAPTLSPDGRWLAYVSDVSGRHEIFVQPFPGPGRRIQVSLDGGFEPRWAHSGRELFYRDFEGNLVAVAVQTNPDFSVGDRRVLFSATRFRNDRYVTLYDVASDDQRFVFIEQISGGEVSWKLVRGYAQVLKEKMGN